MAAGPGGGTASPRTHIPQGTELSPRLELSLQGPGRSCFGEEKGWSASQWLGHYLPFPVSTRCHILRFNDKELNSNFPVPLHFLLCFSLGLPRGPVNITTSYKLISPRASQPPFAQTAAVLGTVLEEEEQR